MNQEKVTEPLPQSQERQRRRWTAEDEAVAATWRDRDDEAAALRAMEATTAAPGTSGPSGCSPSIAQLTEALARAQGQMEGASKDRLNPHFRAAYADLASIWAACREPLSQHGLAILQQTAADGPTVTVATILAHRSGEWVRSELAMKAQQDTPQAIGSCITYARRYALAALVGVAPEDDDGNEASRGDNSSYREAPPKPFAQVQPAKWEQHWGDLTAAADEGTVAFDKAWSAMPPEFKNYVMQHKKDDRAALVARAKGKP